MKTRKIIKCVILSNNCPDMLNNDIKRLMIGNFQPKGDVIVTSIGLGHSMKNVFTMQMVKYEDSKWFNLI